MITLEDWSNEDWGNSAFIRFSDVTKPFCLNMSALKNSFESTKFGNATGGNSEGHGSRLGAERYVKVPCGAGNVYLLTNQGNERAIDRLKQHLNNTGNEAAAVLSFGFQNNERIASVSHNQFDEEFIVIGESMSHGQSDYPVYRLQNHQHTSIEQAEELAKDGKSLFVDIGVEQNLNAQRRRRPTEEVRQPHARTDNAQAARAEVASSFQEIEQLTSLSGEANRQVLIQAAITEITNAFERSFSSEQEVQEQQDAEVARIFQETGHLPSENDEANRQVLTQAAMTEIMNVFARRFLG